MRVARSLVAIAVAGVVGVPTAMAQTINVPADQPTIQAGIVAAVTGDVVNVAPGTYNEHLDLLGKSITVQGTGGASQTVIDAQSTPNNSAIVTSAAQSFTIRGFTIRGGNSFTGGIETQGSSTGLIERNRIIANTGCGAPGASIRGAIIFRSNVVANNRTTCSGGGAIGTVHAEGTSEIRDNLIVNNVGSNGGGIGAEGTPLITGNVVARNSGDGAIYVWTGNPTISNNLIVGNLGSAGIHLDFFAQTASVINNTIVDNQTVVALRVDFAPGSGVLVRNNILGSPIGAVLACLPFTAGTPITPTFVSNDLLAVGGVVLLGSTCGSPVGLSGNVSVDPGLADAAAGDYHLSDTSTLLDAGTPTGAPTVDFDGDARPLDGDAASAGAQFDVGFDEGRDQSQLNTSLGGGPSGTVGPGPWPSFTFQSTTVGATFECDLDLQGFVPCASPFALAALGGHSHLFRVRARTGGGLVDRSPATRLFEVDSTPPDTIRDAGPFKSLDAWVASFHSDDPNATFECAFDAGPFTQCASPYNFVAPSGGLHTLFIRAVDPFGNVDPTPASGSFLVPPPDTFLTQPTPVFSSGKWSTDITSDVAGATFECSLDAAPFAPCSSPLELTVPIGVHTLSARALSGNDVDATPAVVSWTSSCLAFGSSLGETMIGTLSVDAMCGLGGNDVLKGLAGDDFLSGGTGDDVLNGGPGADSLNGNDGIDDVADYSDRSTPVKVILGDGLPDGGVEDGAGDTIGVLVEDIWGGSGSDRLTGDFNDNVIDGGPGADIIQGGPGFDFADYSLATTPVTADLDGQVGDDGRAGEGDSIGIDVESILGGVADDSLTGGSGDDFIAGGSGNDRLTGGAGSDSVLGEDGNDTLIAADGVIDDVDCGPGLDTAYIDVGESVFNCETTIFGAPPPPPPPPPPVAQVHRLRLTGGSGTSKAGLLVKLTCDSNQATLCNVRLVAKTTVVVKGTKRTYTLGQLTTKVAPGLASSLPIRLNVRAATLFKTRAKLTIRVESSLASPSGVFGPGPKRTLIVKRSKTALKSRVLLARHLHAITR